MDFLRIPPDVIAFCGSAAGSGKSVSGHGCLEWLWRYWPAVLATLLAGGLLLNGNAWASAFDEYAVKAAYLYNFAKYVEWPPGTFAKADAPLLIRIVGDNPFGGSLAALSGKSVASHPAEVRPISTSSSLEQCHIVFIGRAEQDCLQAILAKLVRQPILTVSDIGDFAQAGGMIGLVESEQRIRFNINTATRQANLKLSSQLLKLATIVE